MTMERKRARIRGLEQMLFYLPLGEMCVQIMFFFYFRLDTLDYCDPLHLLWDILGLK